MTDKQVANVDVAVHVREIRDKYRNEGVLETPRMRSA